MSTIAPPSQHIGELPWLADRRHTALQSQSGPWIAAGLGLAVVAVLVRVWGISATLGTSDQAAMAWMIRHRFGVKWLFAHEYGPVLSILERVWAELLYRLRLPIGEASVRTPVMLASLAQLPITFALLRRIGCGRGEAGLGTLVCAFLPTLVTDAHYGWGYVTLWLLTGTMSLWATLAYFDTRQRGWLVLAGLSLTAHCLSNCFAFALPLTLLAAWWLQWRTQAPTTGGMGKRLFACPWPHGERAGSTPNVNQPLTADPRHALLRASLVGFVLPCLAALLVIAVLYKWTGGGQLGRVLTKQRIGTLGIPIAQLTWLPRIWSVQFGYLFAIPAAIGLIFATRIGGRRGLLACWCWASLLPMVLLVNWNRVGYPSSYMIDTGFSGGLLGAMMISQAYQWVSGRPVVRVLLTCLAVLAIGHMAIGSANACLQDGSLAAYTGIRTGWGSIKAETGIKAAGWYVRTNVPASAVVMTTHTNEGMEVPVAEYYLGRSVLASYDLPPSIVEPLVRTVAPEVDVLIVEPCWVPLIESLAGFTRTATFRYNGTPVRYVYARAQMNLTVIDSEADPLNDLYNRECITSRVPQPLSAPPRFEACLRHYQDTVHRLR